MAKGSEKDDVLYRVVKFEIKPKEDQLAILRRISDNLWLVWDEALAARQRNFDTHIAPIYEAIKLATQQQDTALVKELRETLKAAYKEHPLTLFDQINALTPRRESDKGFASTPRNWQEETLDTLDGAFKSFVELRKNSDPKARPPRLRSEWDFNEIPGRSGFSIRGGRITLAPNIFGKGMLSWKIPQDYQGIMLSRATKVKKFTLYRDEHDMRKSGRFWISIAYEIPKPAMKPFVAEQAVYVSLGASSIGIVSPHGEETIPLWRADKHWKPRTDSLSERMDDCTKGSRKWRKRMEARQKMFRIMASQQKQDRREIVAIDLLHLHGVHFVVSDIVVRSKPGHIADSSQKDRGGALGLNWSAQNTGSIAYLVQWLEEKVKEYGGTVRKHKLPPELIPAAGIGHENKITMAHALRDHFLSSYSEQAA